MGQLAPHQVDQIRKVLTTAGASWRCWSCGGELTMSNELFALQEAYHRADAGASPSGQAAMCAARVCMRCGVMTLHALAPLGLDTMI